MASDNFPNCLPITLRHEGGWSDHPDDPGGATMKGVTLATYRKERPGATKEDLRRISDDELRKIYRAGYWNPIGGDTLFRGLDLAAFDFAVNSGPGRAKTYLTAARAKASDAVGQIRALCASRLGYVQGLRTWAVFGKGWGRRIGEIEATSLRMAVSNPRQAGIEIAKSATIARTQAQGAAKVSTNASTVGGGGAVVLPTAAAGGADWELMMFVGSLVLVLLIIALVAWKQKEAQDERADTLAAFAKGGT